jgi:DNA invertase Pin-like site-specific DNA recombinase
MRVVGYIRVSSKNKRHQEESAPAQEQTIRAWCKTEGHRLVELDRDVGVSGADDLADRRELPEAVKAISAGHADGLAVRELDQLHRNVMVQENIFADLWAIRPTVEVLSTKPAEGQNCRRNDPDDPTREMIRVILGAVAAYVRGQTVARMAAGKRRKRTAGGYIGGPPQYGQQGADVGTGAHKERVLVADDAEQATIRRIKELRDTGASLRSIAATLDAEGHRPLTERAVAPVQREGRFRSHKLKYRLRG